jgi:hypothetical protein
MFIIRNREHAVMQDTVTFQTILVPSRETPKAWMIWGGTWVPKSQATVVKTGTTSRINRGRQIAVDIVDITMPRWLNERM